jgi:ubiquinone/menaquinone biosynthesis C-methylase UbiE
MKTKIFFKKRIHEPPLMEKVEYDEFNKASFLNYNRWFVFLVDDLIYWMEKLIYKNKKDNIENGPIKFLDVGCGPGYLLVELSKNFKNAEIIGVDYSDYVLKIAKKNVHKMCPNKKNIKLIKADVHKLPFQNGYFDVVICKDSLHHFKNAKVAIGEMIRVTKPGGIVYIQDLRRDLPFYLLKMAIPPDTTFKKLQYYSARAAYTKDEIKKILKKFFDKKIRFFIKTRKLNKMLVEKCKELSVKPIELKYSFQSRFILVIHKNVMATN